MFAYPNIIANSGAVKQSEHQIMSGIIKSTMLTQEQRHDMDGIIRHTLSNEHRKYYDRPAEPETFHVPADKTRKHIGTVRIPAGKY